MISIAAFSQHEWLKDLTGSFAETSNVRQDLMENDKNCVPRHFKTIQEFGYRTSVFYFVVLFWGLGLGFFWRFFFWMVLCVFVLFFKLLLQ